MKYLLILVLLISFSSCQKDEIPVEYLAEPLSTGTFNTQLLMGSDYRYRLYYDLETDSMVARHQKTDWDLSFDAQAGESAVHLNSSKLMSVWKVDDTSIEDLNSLQGEGPLYDAADGSYTAIGDWEASNSIYIIDRGIDGAGQSQGKAKLQILSASDSEYLIRYAELSSTEIIELVIPKDVQRNRVHLSIDEGLVQIEPPREDWDLVFTHYTLFFEDLFGQEDIYYLVAGALINPYSVEALSLENTDFASIDQGYLAGLILSADQDAVGYDWKEYDLAGDIYTILDNAFAIRTVEGNLYKLQFTSFTDATGERGAPSFRAALIQ